MEEFIARKYKMVGMKGNISGQRRTRMKSKNRAMIKFKNPSKITLKRGAQWTLKSRANIEISTKEMTLKRGAQ